MPKAGRLWRHVIINTRGSWLHGDARGFRSRGHRIHSSGDYRHRPPVGEHEGLEVHNEMNSRGEIHIPYEQRGVAGRTIAKYFLDSGYRILVVAATKVHAHFLVELPGAMSEVKRLVGEAKRVSSRAVKDQLPGSVWSAGGTFKRVLTRSHCRSVHDYILYDQGPSAWTWTYRDGNLQGKYARKRPRRK